MFKQIAYAHSVISLEAMQDSTAGSAAARLPAYLESITDFFTQKVGQSISDLFSRKDVAWMVNNYHRRTYADLRGVEVRVPPGFKGTLADYGVLLADTAQKMDRVLDEVLIPFARWVSEKIDDPQSLSNLTNTLRVPGLKELAVNKFEDALDSYYPDKTRSSSATYSDVFARQQDWDKIAAAMRQIEQVYATKRYDQTREKIRDLAELLRKLAETITQHRVEFKLSSVTIKQLADLTFEIAKQMEFYGVLRHRIEEYATVMQENVELVRAKF